MNELTKEWVGEEIAEQALETSTRIRGFIRKKLNLR